jgi:hypothetical protein
MAIRYLCLDDKYLIPDPEWSYHNDGTPCYVKAEDYERVLRELEELRMQLRYSEFSGNTK